MTDEADTAEVDELERRWRASPIGTSGTIHLLVRRIGSGAHELPRAVELGRERGLIGDRWARGKIAPRDAQVSMIERRVADLVAGDPGRRHLTGDNLVVDLDLSMAALPVGARLAASDVVLEITALGHTGCATFRSRLGDAALRWVNGRDRRARRLRGVYARIVRGGVLHLRDRLVRA